MKARFKLLLATYGRWFLGVYLALSVLAYVGFFIALKAGFRPDGVGESVGTFVAAWLASKVTQPVRLAVAAAATPFVARLFQRTAENVATDENQSEKQTFQP